MLKSLVWKLSVCVSIAVSAALPLRAQCANPALSPIDAIAAGHDAAELAIGDLDGDGELDLVTVSTTSGTINIRLGHGDGTFSDALTYTAPSPTEVTLGDLDDDGFLDIVVASEPPQTAECVAFGSCAGLSVLLNDGDGTFGLANTTPVPYAASVVGVDAADFNADGHDDVVVAAPPLVSGDPALHAFLANATGGFASSTEWAVDGPVLDAVAANLTAGTGQADIVALAGPGTSSTQTRVLTYQSQNATFPSISGTRNLSTITSSEGHLATADFNANGTVDIAASLKLFTSPMDVWGVAVVLTNGPGSLTFGGSYADSQVGVITDLVADDVDEDGDMDVLVVSGGSNWYSFARQSGNFLNETRGGSFGTGTQRRVLNDDFNHDGRPDFFALDTANDAVRILENSCFFRYVKVTLTSTPNPSTFNSEASFQITVQPKDGAPMPQGTVTLFEGDTILGSAPVNDDGNATITLSNLSVGTHSLRAQLAATNDFQSAFSNTYLHTVSLPPFGPPPNVVATGNAAANKITIRWSQTAETVSYDIRRRSGGAWTTIGSVSNTDSFVDANVNASTAYVYAVRAHRSTGEISAESLSDIATTAVVLLPGDKMIRATDFTTTRTLVNSLRTAAGLTAFTFTDPSLTNVKVKAAHLTELRTALNQARTALGFAALTFTNATITVNVTPIRQVDIQEIRSSLQ